MARVLLAAAGTSQGPPAAAAAVAAAAAASHSTMADYQQGHQGVVDRLKRRITNYRVEHNSVARHHETTFPTVFEAENKRTLSLKQRHVEAKNKKSNKKDNKKIDTPPLTNMGVSWVVVPPNKAACSSCRGCADQILAAIQGCEKCLAKGEDVF